MQQKKIMKNLTINCNNIQISNDKQICLIAGPCQLETEQHALDMAGELKNITDKYNIGSVSYTHLTLPTKRIV